MVRQRKCHTRIRKSLSGSMDVADGQTAEMKLEEGKSNRDLKCKPRKRIRTSQTPLRFKQIPVNNGRSV